MRSLSDTISRLAHLRNPAAALAYPAADRLFELRDFGSNPGALRGWLHVPQGLEKGAALVVVLHGCTQTAAGYDHGAGWSELADRHGFAVLLPEQQRANNPNLCFNWYDPEDNTRGMGEAQSIRQMVEATAGSLGIGAAKVFVTGLSAGGAMAGVMLATYPEVFAGGAIIAGLPYDSARTVPEAFDRMRGHGIPSEAELAALVRGASAHDGPWPTLSVWHGSSDATVHPANAKAVVAQWRSLHGLDAAPTLTERVGGHTRRLWRDPVGRDLIEEFTIAGMGHGTPLKAFGEDGCGSSGPFMIEAGISSSHEICRFWGLLDSEERMRPASGIVPSSSEAHPVLAAAPQAAAAFGHPKSVSQVIEEALRAAGLMR